MSNDIGKTSGKQKFKFAMFLVTIGIVYGDIGTSPMYVMKSIVADNGGITGVCKWCKDPKEVEFALTVLERLAEDLKPYATVEQQPKMEGRNMHMLVAPIKGAFDKKPEGNAE